MGGYVLGGLCILAGISLWGLAIFAFVSWVIFCFGTVVIGLLLLFFAPHLLLFPLALNVFGTGLIKLGVKIIDDHQLETRMSRLAAEADQAENCRASQRYLGSELARLERELSLLELEEPSSKKSSLDKETEELQTRLKKTEEILKSY